MDPTQDPSGGLDQQAIDSALDTYNKAAQQYTNLAEQYDNMSSATTTDAKGNTVPKYSQGDINDAARALDNARSQLGSASRAYSTILGQVANQRSANARAAGNPAEVDRWNAMADDARAHQKLYSAEADMYQAKTTADIQNATTRANAALQDAQTRASRVQTQNDKDASDALLANAKAATIPALAQSTIAMHQQAIQTGAARAQEASARAAKEQAQTDYLIPAQVDDLVQKGLLDQAKADQIKQMGPVKIDELTAKIGLDQAKVNQIKAALTKWNVLPATDHRSPILVEQQPTTGEIRGVPDPGYVNTQLQGITDTNQAIDAVQSQIANGTMSPQDGDQLINNLRQALQYKALGVTPDQYLQAQNQQAQLGMNVLNNYMGTINKGQDVANQFLGAARGIRNLPAGVNFTPFSTMGQIAQNVYGPSLQKAQQLISQVQPVTDQFSALKAFSQLSQIKQHLTDATQQQGGAAPGGPDQVNQATNAGVNAAQNATDAAGGNPNMLTPSAVAGIPPDQLLQMAQAAGLGVQP